ncbi:hypothetical protein [Sulfurimonas sp. HSL3-7]|uniref:hypothetical protein n=1 Tax=Sulfonitrofixus jiaomeiensis TaxID=3131938 RepID=UPI0031F9DFB2
MSKGTSFGFTVLLFLLLSGVVLFGFFVFTPKIKAYRALSIGIEQTAEDVKSLEKEFDKEYGRLQALQEKEKKIDIALHKSFDQKGLEGYLQHYFSALTLTGISSTKSNKLQVDTLDVRAKIASPAEYYRFIDALNEFDWVGEVVGALQFKGEADGIATHFTLQVYTKAP